MSEDLSPVDDGRYDLDGYADAVSFVAGTTGAIWDHKNPGLISRWYTPTTLVHTSDGDTYGSDVVIANSMAKMAAFPDIRDLIEETVWAQTPEGFLTSMRWVWTAHNTGHGTYGPPTNRAVRTRGIANCVIRHGKYVEEWVAYDEITTLRQLGIDVDRYVAEHPLEPDESGAADTDRLVGQAFPGPLSEGDGEAVPGLRSLLHEIWNRRMLGRVDDLYDDCVVYHGPDARERYGRADVRQEIMTLLAMLPDARFYVDELYANPLGEDGQTVALRWTLLGTHRGPSRYGPPTGRRLRLMGLSHLHMRDGLVAEEWTVYSELNLLRQMRAPRLDGDAVPPATGPEGLTNATDLDGGVTA